MWNAGREERVDRERMTTGKRNRVPGSPEEKRELLSKLDAESFPYLVADILHFVRRHTNVHVMDGPGDGRRDVVSKDAAGLVHITQTKCHGDPNQGVGARELDEIVIALKKFGATHGLFATTGRISPQAKREYLDYFPELALEFLEGTDIVDEVLAHPVLAQVWCEGEKIQASARPLVVPLVLRDAKTDIQVCRGPEPKGLGLGVGVVTFAWGAAPADVFVPYRPTVIPDPLSSRAVVRAMEATLRGAVHLHELERTVQDVVRHIANSEVAQGRTLQVRVGLPSFPVPDRELVRERVNLDVLKPATYVAVNGAFESEYEWVVPFGLAGWEFPEDFGTLEAEWAGWFSSRLDTILMVGVRTPVSEHTVGVHEFNRRVAERFMAESLFAVGLEASVDPLLESIGEADRPDYRCSYGPLVLLAHMD
jgi:hypothetical protein